MDRREALRVGMFAAAAGLCGGAAAASQPAGRKRALRLAHMTDLHTQPELKADQGVMSCFRHVRTQSDRPGLILLGGDLVMDSFEATDARTRQQWDLVQHAMREDSSIPMEACLGNHDVWGINKAKSKTTGNEPGWGKKRAMDLLGLPRAFRSFDRNGWHFVLLDSVMPKGDGYIGKLDDEQWEWLEGDLKSTRLPTLILSHIPILAATQLVSAKRKDDGPRQISDSRMMSDASRFVALFEKTPSVKLCLSGHIHELDRVDYQGVTYLCNGAVSGNWWKGRHKMCDEGYALVDLFDDGSFENRYVTYGWKAAAE